MNADDILAYIAPISGMILIACLVALKNIHNRLNQLFVFFSLVSTSAIACSFISHSVHTNSGALMWTRSALLFADFIPLGFYLFTLAFTQQLKSKKKYTYGILLTSIVLAPLAYLPESIKSVVLEANGTTINRTGPIIIPTLLFYVVVFGYCFYLLLKYSKTAIQSTRNQIKLIVWATAFTIIFNLVTQIAIPEFHATNIGSLIGNPSVLVFIAAVGYSILRQRLFDVRAVVLRSFGFLMTLFLVMVIFSILILGPGRLLFHGLQLSSGLEIYFVFAATLLAFLFNPLKIYLQRITDRLFYQDRYSTEVVVNQIGAVLASEIILDKLCHQLIDILARTIRVKKVDIIVLNKGSIYYEAENYFKEVAQEFLLDVHKMGDEIAVRDELEDNEIRRALVKYGISVFAPLKIKSETVGYLLFNDKVSGLPYDSHDVRVIDIITDSLAVAIQNSLSVAQIQQFNQILQKKVEESTHKLILANEQLKKSDATKDDFVSMASHQLGTPLSVMDGYLTLSTQGFYGKLDEKLQGVLKKTLSRTRLMEHLVFDLLNLSRMNAGKFFLELTDFDFNSIIPEEVSELEEEAHDQSVKLKYHPPKDPVPILHLDEPKTRQAIMNLVNNAIFYAPNGTVDVYLDYDGSNIIFKVIDSGIGVPDNQKPMLFTKFFRADNAKEKSPNGTGIGLYLVKRIVEDQHGKLIFSSQVGKGSTFGFSLPVIPEAPKTLSQPAPKQTVTVG